MITLSKFEKYCLNCAHRETLGITSYCSKSTMDSYEDHVDLDKSDIGHMIYGKFELAKRNGQISFRPPNTCPYLLEMTVESSNHESGC